MIWHEPPILVQGACFPPFAVFFLELKVGKIWTLSGIYPPTQHAILANTGLDWDFLVYVMSSWWWLESWVPGGSKNFPVSQVSLHKLLLFDDAIHVGIKVLEPGFQHGSLLSNNNTSRVWLASHPKKKGWDNLSKQNINPSYAGVGTVWW